MAFHLTSKNFRVSNSGEKKTLNIDMGGKVLLFIRMDTCSGCAAFYPIFQNLSMSDKRINYAIADITSPSEKTIVRLSRETTTPIEIVPFILMYNNGVPFAKYTGKKTFEGVQGFITTILNKIAETAPLQRQFVQDVPKQGYPPYGPSQYNRSGGGHYEPEIGTKIPSSKSSGLGMGMINDIEEEEEDTLMIPDEITPHNVPWKSDYKKLSID